MDVIPELIVKILVSCGYDTALSIAKFNETDIKIVEEHTNKNFKEVVKQYELYSNIHDFEFLPGHRKLKNSLRVVFHIVVLPTFWMRTFAIFAFWFMCHFLREHLPMYSDYTICNIKMTFIDLSQLI